MLSKRRRSCLFKISEEVERKRETQHIHKNIDEIIISKYCQPSVQCTHTHTHMHINTCAGE